MVHLVLRNLSILANKKLSNREDSGTFFPKYNKLSKIVNLIVLIMQIIFLTICLLLVTEIGVKRLLRKSDSLVIL